VKSKAVLIIALFVFFIVACNDMGKSSVDTTIAAKKEKKVSNPVKLKRKKIISKPTTGKTKTEIASVKSGEEDEEESKEKLGEEEEKAAIRNIMAAKVNNYAVQNNMSTEYCFLVDMSLPSGKNRFFIYDLKKNSIIHSGLVAHGSCNETFLSRPRFSNVAKGGCSSLGKYKLGEFYRGKYGKSYRLYGLDNCNSNAYKRAVVIHGYDCVPDGEIYPRVLCNSQGCPMVSYKFFDKISKIIGRTDKPILLWIYQ
jgi:predicted XRE-type DNA-binding protein